MKSNITKRVLNILRRHPEGIFAADIAKKIYGKDAKKYSHVYLILYRFEDKVAFRKPVSGTHIYKWVAKK